MEASKGICGTLIFLSLLIMIIEGLVIAQRFLNVGLVERHNQAFIIAVSISILTKCIYIFAHSIILWLKSYDGTYRHDNKCSRVKFYA